MGDGTENIAEENNEKKCPKCGKDMEEQEQDYSNMTEGQQTDYDAGFNRPFECPSCKFYGLFDVGYQEDFVDWEDPEVDELVKIIRIDPRSFEHVIEHALKSKCFIEAISLIHNTIEAYLRKKIEDFTKDDKERLELLKNKFKPRYLFDYNTISYLLGIIDNATYNSILDFNENRNKVIHELLTNPKDISQIKIIARKGRELQFKLSPLNLSDLEIADNMADFDNITR